MAATRVATSDDAIAGFERLDDVAGAGEPAIDRHGFVLSESHWTKSRIRAHCRSEEGDFSDNTQGYFAIRVDGSFRMRISTEPTL